MDFTEIPADNRDPLVAAEIDASQSGAAAGGGKTALFIGHATGGTANANELVTVGGVGTLDALFGARSQLAAMIRAFREVNEDATVYAIPITGGGAAATADVTFGGVATEDGAVEIFVDGIRYVASVSTGDDATAVAASVEAVLDAVTRMHSTAAAAAGVLTLTAAWSGPSSSTLSVAIGTLPAGVTAAVVDFAGGATAPSLATAIGAMEETRYDAVVTGLGDATSLTSLEAEVSRRWGALERLGGHIYAAFDGTFAEALAFGAGRNAPETTNLPTLESETPAHIWAAQMAARVLAVTRPTAPFNGLSLPSVKAPPLSARLEHGERNQLLRAGMSTYRVDGSGEVVLSRLITTHLTTDGEPDTTWLALTTRLTVDVLRDDWVTRLKRKYQRYSLADDGTNIQPGVKILTPSTIRAEALAWAREKEAEGLIERIDEFKGRLQAVRNGADRVDVLITPDLVNELVTIATSMAFRV